jgi:hypothetical protein
MYSLQGTEEITTRLCWHAGRKAFVYGTQSGEIVPVSFDSTARGTGFSDDGAVLCFALNSEGNKCVVAVDGGNLKECNPISGEMLTDSRLNGTTKDTAITHLQYDSNGSHL